jgi:hypothetical protein
MLEVNVDKGELTYISKRGAVVVVDTSLVTVTDTTSLRLGEGRLGNEAHETQSSDSNRAEEHYGREKRGIVKRQWRKNALSIVLLPCLYPLLATDANEE